MDRPENQQDTSARNSSEGTKGTSEQPETFTKEEVAEAAKKAAEDALSAAGRTAKNFEQREGAIKAEREKMAQEQKAKDEAELEDAREDDDKLSRIKARQKARDTATELAKTTSELEVEKAKTKEAQEVGATHTKEQNAREVASRLGVNADTLIKFTDGSVKAMEELAKSLSKKTETKTLLSDSSKTAGGVQMADSSGGKMLSGFEQLHK
ncbi:hypothetical protein LCGC14_0420700 [marine sediment metagenome]|uniref:DUF4355 domain-containing protein n=1 Tax=marine sediment metagenome TaxID=412755 RepID=A0A0F9VD50_9ZZZZ